MAGGHNALPRGFQYDAKIKMYSNDLKMSKFTKVTKGLPFWLAGLYADPSLFCDVVKIGGAGVQVETAFVIARGLGMESKIQQDIKLTVWDTFVICIQKKDGTMGFCCASKLVDAYFKRGGEIKATHGRKCL
eukprot:2925241-Ditylum_brightwellii.AAC.1